MGPMALPPPISADDDGVDLLPEMVFQSADGGHDLVAGLQLFIAHRRRAHATDCADQRIVRHIIGLNDRDCAAALPQFVFQAQAVEIGAAAATRAQDTGADGDGMSVV